MAIALPAVASACADSPIAIVGPPDPVLALAPYPIAITELGDELYPIP